MIKKYSDWLYDYRTFVGPPDKYDIVGSLQFSLLIFLGLREQHTLLDIGCGSLRGGRFFIMYLQKNNYFGIEPEQWLIDEGIKNEIGKEIVQAKKPTFSNENEYKLGVFNRKFDYIIAHSIFSHAPQQDIIKCLSGVKSVMKPDSVFAASFIEGKENYTGDEWVYPEGVTYTLEHIKDMIQGQGLSCRQISWPHPNLQKWLGIVQQGEEELIPDLSDMTTNSRLKYEITFGNERISRLNNRIAELNQMIEHLNRRNSEFESDPFLKTYSKLKNMLKQLTSLARDE